jgi:hypothetical protein
MAAFDTSQTTSLPTWFTNAQQNAAQGVTSALNNMTQPGQTVGAGVAQSLSGPTNPFTQGTATLQDIAQGAANPWLANGQPDTNTTLGGLFASQNAKLDQILPSIAAKEGAAGIGSGNYGGLRGQTAVDTAKAGALTTLGEQQNQTALNALTQATQAETASGNLESQYGTTGLNVANWQQLGALPSYTQAATALCNIGAKTDVTQTKNAGLSANVTSAANLAKNLGVAAGDIAAGKTGVAWLDKILAGSKSVDLGGGIVVNPDGSVSGGTFNGGSGSTGDAYTDALTGLTGDFTSTGGLPDTSGYTDYTDYSNQDYTA